MAIVFMKHRHEHIAFKFWITPTSRIAKHGKLQLGATRMAIQAYHSYDGTFIRTGKGWEDIQSSSNSTLVDTSSVSDAQAVKKERRRDMAHVPQDRRSQNLERYPNMVYHSHQNGALQRRDPLQPGSVQWDMHIPKEESPNSAESNHMVYHNGADSPFQGTAPIQPGDRSPNLEMHIPKDEFGNSVGSSQTAHSKDPVCSNQAKDLHMIITPPQKRKRMMTNKAIRSGPPPTGPKMTEEEYQYYKENSDQFSLSLSDDDTPPPRKKSRTMSDKAIRSGPPPKGPKMTKEESHYYNDNIDQMVLICSVISGYKQKTGFVRQTFLTPSENDWKNGTGPLQTRLWRKKSSPESRRRRLRKRIVRRKVWTVRLSIDRKLGVEWRRSGERRAYPGRTLSQQQVVAQLKSL
ncbi:unnamed protein product [Caenorhabditis brenneri]